MQGSPDQLKRELSGDALQVELAEFDGDAARAALADVDGLEGVEVEGRTLRARAADGGAALPGVLAALDGRGIRVASVEDRAAVARRRLPPARRPSVRPGGAGERAGAGMIALRQSWQVYLRWLRVLRRQPAFLLITVVQPIVWLLLFGALFKAVADIPGFHGTYIDFLTPGVVVMLAVFSAGWSGMGFVEDIQGGVMNRMLASPVWRGALNVGSVAYAAFSMILQALLVIGLALILGADFKGGVGGVVAMLVVASLLAAIGRVAVERRRPGRAPARDRDRGRQLRPAAAHVPLHRHDAEGPAASLDAGGRQVQSGQLGGRGGPIGGDAEDGLGARRQPRRAARRADARRRLTSPSGRSSATSGRSELVLSSPSTA